MHTNSGQHDTSDRLTDRQFDGFLGRHANQLGQEATVEAKEALVSHNLLEAV